MINSIKEEIRLTETPIEDCFKYIKDDFNNIIPFDVSSGYSFQIRIDEDTYKEIPGKYKDELKQFSCMGIQDNREDDVWNRYLTDHFWITTCDYLFHFRIRTALQLYTQCKYGYEGLEEYKKSIVFIDSKEMSPFILMNIGLNTDIESVLNRSSRQKPAMIESL